MVNPYLYTSDEAMARQQQAAKEAYERSKARAESYNNGTVIDAEFYEVDSVAGLIENRTKGLGADNG